MGLEEVGRHMGLVGERVRQIEEVALAKLRMVQELVVASCTECPCLEKGRCAHPALKVARETDAGAPPRWCPLAAGPLVVMTRLAGGAGAAPRDGS
jgi:hypothetical protein